MTSTPRKSWIPKKLNELGYVGRGKSKCRPRNDPSLYGGEYPFIQTGEIKAANLYISDYVQTYNDKGLSQSKLWPPQTLCITIAANIAETAILKIPACFPDSVATSRSWNTSDGERRTETEWFNVVAWSNLAEICNQHLSKGQQVYVEGRLQTRQWEDSKGNRHSSTEVVANEMIKLDDRRTINTTDEVDNPDDKDELPF